MTQATTFLEQKEKQQIFAEKDFHIGLLSPLIKEKNSEIFTKIVEDLCSLGFKIEVLASGDKDLQNICFEISNRYPENLEVLEDIPQNKLKILRSSDILLFTGECDDKKLLKEIIKKGKVTVMPYLKSNLEFSNFNAQIEIGESFLFNKNNKAEFLAVIIRSYENFKFSYDWNNLRKRIKKLKV